MIPIKPLENGSRRSSILKIPKQRQAFQSIVEKPSLPEVTTTNNIKRRVSFAEKKRVKEFCDSFDQGIGWDNTYEESDSSNQRHLRSFSTDQGTITQSQSIHQSSVLSLDKENQVVKFCTFEEKHCEVNFESKSQNEASTITMQTNTTNMQQEMRNSSSQIVFQETICDNETMTFTKALPSVPQNDKENIYIPSGESNGSEDVSMEFTEAVPNCIRVDEDSMDLTLAVDGNNETLLNELSMEMTTAIPSKALKRLDLSMEITSAVPCMPIVEGNRNFPPDGDDLRSVQQATNKTLSQDLSMEFTEAVPRSGNQLFRNKTLSRNESMEFTNVHCSKNVQLVSNKTLSQNASMELTNVVPRAHGDLYSASGPSNKTLSQNVSMEFTTMVPRTIEIFTNIQSSVPINKTLLSQNESMEFTGIVPKTLCSQNESMEFTNVENEIDPLTSEPVASPINDSPGKLKLTDSNQLSEKENETGLLTNKRRRLSENPSENSLENIQNLRSESTLKNGQHDFGQTLRRSESVVNSELTEPIFRHDSSMTVNMTSNILQFNDEEIRNFQEKTIDIKERVSRVSVPAVNSDSLLNASETVVLEKDVKIPLLRDVNSDSFLNPSEIEILENRPEEKRISHLFIPVNSDSSDIEIFEKNRCSQVIVPVGNSDSILNATETIVLEKRPEDKKRISDLISLAPETESIESSKKRKKNESADVSVPDLNCESFLNVSETQVLETRQQDESQPTISPNLENSNKTNPIHSTRNENDLLEHEEPPSFMFFDMTNQIENSGQEIPGNVELDPSKNLSNAKRKLPEESDAKRSEQIIELIKCRRTFVINKENQLQSFERTNQKMNNFRRTFVVSTEHESHQCESLVQVMKDARELISRAETVSSKMNTINLKIDSVFKTLKKIRIPEKNVYHRNTEIVHQNSEIHPCGKGNSLQDVIMEMNVEESANDVNRINDPSDVDEPFYTFRESIRAYSKRNDCIWNLRSLNKEMLAVNYISKSFVVVLKLNQPSNNTFQDIRSIQIESLISDTSNDLLQMIHDLIVKKLRPEKLLESHKLYNDVIPLLEEIATEVKLALDFMSELQKLKNLHLMEINVKRVSFLTRTKRMIIILKVSLNIKPFDEIDADDVEVDCLLGSINASVVKQLIVNVKKDHKFLRRFINDVKDYVEIIEEFEEK